jgi:hypothetical protein
MKIEDDYFPWESIPDKEMLRPSTTPITAAELQGMVFPPLEWIISEILPNGIALLVGDPKAGKTRLATNLALAISRGELALGKLDCKKRGVLCLFLEDTKRSMQKRIEKLLPPGEGWPDNLILVDAWPSDVDGLQKLDQFLLKNPHIKIVFVDVWDHIRPLFTGRGNLYQYDNRSVASLRKVLAQHDVSAVLLHHTNKNESKDKFKKISGSQGLFGAVDTGWVLEREPGSEQATLDILGREVMPQRLQLEYDEEDGRWTLLGNAAFYAMSEARQIYYEYVKANPGAKPKEIAEATGRNRSTTRTILLDMLYQRLLQKDEDGGYWVRES